MNTPAHMALGLAVLGRRPGRGDWAIILAGALLPDLMYFIGHFDRGLADPVLTDALNSLPLWSALVLVGLGLRRRWLTLLAASALLHVLFDLPLHAGDAHRHLWPLSGWTFASPVSFWDADHHGRLFGTLEGVLFAACLALLWPRSGTWRRVVLAVLGVVYVAAFVHFIGHVYFDSHWAVW